MPNTGAAPTAPKGLRAKALKKPASKNAKSRSGAASSSQSRRLEALKRKAKRLRSGKPEEVLARKARRVCQTLGIDGLAKRYNVEATAEAVASAYAASYPPTFRTAVHDGCKSAFPRQ